MVRAFRSHRRRLSYLPFSRQTWGREFSPWEVYNAVCGSDGGVFVGTVKHKHSIFLFIARGTMSEKIFRLSFGLEKQTASFYYRRLEKMVPMVYFGTGRTAAYT